MDKHPIDQWQEEADSAQKEFQKQILLDTSLVYQVFSTEAGQKLLARWVDVLISQPTANKGDDLLSIGMSEGYKNFVRTILNSVKIHEDKQ